MTRPSRRNRRQWLRRLGNSGAAVIGIAIRIGAAYVNIRFYMMVVNKQYLCAALTRQLQDLRNQQYAVEAYTEILTSPEKVSDLSTHLLALGPAENLVFAAPDSVPTKPTAPAEARRVAAVAKPPPQERL